MPTLCCSPAPVRARADRVTEGLVVARNVGPLGGVANTRFAGAVTHSPSVLGSVKPGEVVGEVSVEGGRRGYGRTMAALKLQEDAEAPNIRVRPKLTSSKAL